MRPGHREVPRRLAVVEKEEGVAAAHGLDVVGQHAIGHDARHARGVERVVEDGGERVVRRDGTEVKWRIAR